MRRTLALCVLAASLAACPSLSPFEDETYDPNRPTQRMQAPSAGSGLLGNLLSGGVGYMLGRHSRPSPAPPPPPTRYDPNPPPAYHYDSRPSSSPRPPPAAPRYVPARPGYAAPRPSRSSGPAPSRPGYSRRR